MKKNNKLIKALKNIRNKVLLMNIWYETKSFVEEELMCGTITEVLKRKTKKFYTCPGNVPIEYCYRENIEEEFIVKTTAGKKLIIKQYYYGINFEAPCDDTNVLIYDEYNNLLLNGSEYLKENNVKKLKLDN